MIAAMLRVKNEARWIAEVLGAALRLCDHAFVMDDNSTDGTAEICSSISGVTVFGSPFEGLDEARDKDWLLTKVRESSPEWVLSIDGDEVLAADAVPIIRGLITTGAPSSYSLRVVYLWDRTDQARIDGVYGQFFRPSLFRVSAGTLSFRRSGYGGNFHCGNVPNELAGTWQRSTARLLHYGYLHQSDRLRKHAWYNAADPNNLAEDNYRHMIQGDPGGPSAMEQLLHAGPLKLEKLCA